MSEQDQTVDVAAEANRKPASLYYRENGKLQKLELLVSAESTSAGENSKLDFVDKATADKSGGDGDGEATEEEKLERDVVELLTKHLTQMYNQGETYLGELTNTTAADGKDTLLGSAIALLEEKDAVDDKPALNFLRTKRRLDRGIGADVPILEQFTELAVENMTDPEVAQFFPPNVVADYAALEPKESCIRLLVIENLAVTSDPDYIIMQRKFCFVARRCHAASGDDKIVADDRTAVVHYITWGYSITERSDARNMTEDKKKTGLTDGERERAVLAQDRLGKAQKCYIDRREKRREAVIRARMPQILEFITMACATSLVRRMDEAAPNLPPKLMLRVPIEKAGSIIDKDNIMGATYKDVKERKTELVKDSHKLASELKQLSERAGAPDATDTIKMEAEDKLRETIAMKNALRTVEDLEAALANVDPEKELLLHIVEKGLMQDSGRDIQAFFKIMVPYDTIRKRLKQVGVLLANRTS